jgi:hypothetical protein
VARHYHLIDQLLKASPSTVTNINLKPLLATSTSAPQLWTINPSSHSASQLLA